MTWHCQVVVATIARLQLPSAELAFPKGWGGGGKGSALPVLRCWYMDPAVDGSTATFHRLRLLPQGSQSPELMNWQENKEMEVQRLSI